MNKKNNLLDNFFNFLKNHKVLLLISIFLLGLALRLVVSSNLTPVADEMVHGVHALGFSKLAPLSAVTQGPIWYYLTDLAYRIFGVSLLTARFLSFIFGSLTILLVYLIASMLFNKKAGIISAFLLAVSAFHITWTSSYQDQTMMFFILLASYFFIKKYREDGKISLISAVLLGIAELIKIISGAFILIFLAFSTWLLYKNYRVNKKLFKENLLRLGIFIIILLISLTPIILYNVFLYKNKGIVDLPLAQFLRINPEFYTGPGLAHGEGFVLNKLVKNLYSIITVYFINEDLLIFILGLCGIVYLSILTFKEDQKFEKLFFIVMFIFGLLFIASSIVLQTHYTSFFPLFAIFAAPFILFVESKLKNMVAKKYLVLVILLIVLIFNLIQIHSPLTSQSATQKLRSYVSQSVDQNTLVVVDSRIYVGTYTWMFNDKHYLNANYLFDLNNLDNSTKPAEVKAIFVECVTDDCGWGTIKDQPDLNASMEMLVSQFKQVSQAKSFDGGSSIKGVRGEELIGSPFYRIYSSSILVNPSLLQVVDQTHSHFFYRIPRNIDPKNSFDYYEVNGAFNKLLNLFGYLILYLLIIVAVISTTIPFYLLIKNNKM